MLCRGVDSCGGREVGLCSAALLSSKIILGFARNNTLCDQPGNCIQKGKETIVCSLYRYIQDYLIGKIFARKKLCWNLKSVWVAEPEG